MSLEIVTNREFLEYLVCNKCNLCAFDCRYLCRFVRERKVELDKLELELKGIELAIPIIEIEEEKEDEDRQTMLWNRARRQRLS